MSPSSKPRVTIEYCPRCGWLLRAAWLAQELLTTFESDVAGVELAPSDASGTFQIRIDETITLNAIIGFDSLVCDGQTRPVRGSSGVTDAQVQAAVTAGTNNNVAPTLTLANLVVNGTFENGRTVFAVNPARSSFFTNFAFIGAVQTAIATDFGNWTCNSSILNFGSTTGSCTSLPVY